MLEIKQKLQDWRADETNEEMKINFSDDEIDSMIKELDTNGDGVVNQEEFEKALGSEVAKQKEEIELLGDGVVNPILLKEKQLDMEFTMDYLSEQLTKEGGEQDRMKANI